MCWCGVLRWRGVSSVTEIIHIHWGRFICFVERLGVVGWWMDDCKVERGGSTLMGWGWWVGLARGEGSRGSRGGREREG